jgi:hypothetical protein
MQEARWGFQQEEFGKWAKELKERSGICNHQCRSNGLKETHRKLGHIREEDIEE